MDKSEYQKLMNFINREDPKAFVTIYNVSSMQYQPKILSAESCRKGRAFCGLLFAIAAWYTQVRKYQSAWRESMLTYTYVSEGNLN